MRRRGLDGIARNLVRAADAEADAAEDRPPRADGPKFEASAGMLQNLVMDGLG